MKVGPTFEFKVGKSRGVAQVTRLAAGLREPCSVRRPSPETIWQDQTALGKSLAYKNSSIHVIMIQARGFSLKYLHYVCCFSYLDLRTETCRSKFDNTIIIAEGLYGKLRNHLLGELWDSIPHTPASSPSRTTSGRRINNQTHNLLTLSRELLSLIMTRSIATLFHSDWHGMVNEWTTQHRAVAQGSQYSFYIDFFISV